MRQKNGMLVGIFSLVICVIIVMGVMTPIVSDWTTGERIENEGAGWLRMSYESSPSYQSIAADLSGEGVVIYNDSDGTPEGTQTLTGTEDTIIYADDNLAFWYENDTLFLLGQIDGEPVFVQRNDAISLIRESNGIRVSATDTPTITFPFPTYAYEPNSNGKYAFFTNGTPVETESGRPNAIVGGGFAGVYAYNNIFRYAGLGLGMGIEYDEDGKLVNVSWDKITEEENTETPEPLGAPYIRITHEYDIDEIDSVSSSENGGLRAVPTPTYTDGEWGYEYNGDGATIVSYSGAGGNIVMPDTVGGRTVLAVGKGGSGDRVVIDNSSISANSTLTLPSTITRVNYGAFAGCTNLAGPLVIPDSVTYIGDSTFNYTNFTSLTLPNGLTHIGKHAFENNTKYTGELIIPDTVTMIDQSAFNNTSFSGVLKLPSNLTTLGLSAFNSCSNLTGVIIPPTITQLQGSVFNGCGFTSFDIPPTLTKIGNYSVSGTKISTLIIPNTVTSIGMYAFYNTPTLTSLIVLSDATPQTSAFGNTSNLKEVLNLGNATYTTTSYGLNADEVSDSIGECFGYISFTEIGSDPAITGPIATLLIAVPLLMVVGLTIAAMTVMRGRVQ